MLTIRLFLALALRFLQERTRESAARLCAVLCCLSGCTVAIRAPAEWQTVTALVGGGTVALLTRTKHASSPPTEAPDATH